MKLDRNLKPELCVSSDPTRLSLSNLSLEVGIDLSGVKAPGGVLVATDAHTLIAMCVEEVAADVPGPVAPIALATARKECGRDDTRLTCDAAALRTPSGISIPRPTEDANGKFPPWRRVVPDSRKGDISITFDAELLHQIQRAMNGKRCTITFDRTDSAAPIVVKVAGGEANRTEHMAVLMPIRGAK